MTPDEPNLPPSIELNGETHKLQPAAQAVPMFPLRAAKLGSKSVLAPQSKAETKELMESLGYKPSDPEWLAMGLPTEETKKDSSLAKAVRKDYVIPDVVNDTPNVEFFCLAMVREPGKSPFILQTPLFCFDPNEKPAWIDWQHRLFNGVVEGLKDIAIETCMRFPSQDMPLNIARNIADKVGTEMVLPPAIYAEHKRLRDAIIAHRSQRADDRCVEDDDRLYEVLGDGIKCDRRVGCQLDMIGNCVRFVKNRTEEGGPWVSYAELEAANAELMEQNTELQSRLNDATAKLTDEQLIEIAAARSVRPAFVESDPPVHSVSINGRQHVVHGTTLSYNLVCDLAGFNSHDVSRQLTVTWCLRGTVASGGILPRDGVIPFVPNLIVNVADTSKA